ncbi:MAG: glycosyl transferase, family 2 [Bacteroidetes bacterium]|nr:glycosyl transferase, family 2 [Bacteroidota bacterium]
MNTPLLSIVIPCRNEAKNIGNTLDALLGQTGLPPDTQIIIADAGSTDGTIEIISQYSELLNIKIVDGGLPAAGRNKGANHTDSGYILFLDADVMPGERNTISEALSLAESKNLDLVSTHIHTINGNYADRFFWQLHGFASATKIVGAFAAGMFILIKSEAFRRIGGFDESIALGEDWELTHQIASDKFSIAPGYINTTNRRFSAQGYLRTFYQYFMVAISDSYRHKDHRKYFDVHFN